MLTIQQLFRERSQTLLTMVCFSAYIALSPIKLFFLNRYYYSVDASLLILVCFSVFLILTLVLLFLSARLSDNFESVFFRSIFTLLTLLFIYDNVLYSFIPELDGNTSAVTTPLLYLFDVLFLGLIFLVFWKDLFQKQRYVSNILYFIFFLAVLQMSVVVISAEEAAPTRQTSASDEQTVGLPKLALSTEINVIQILFDTFQSTEFPVALAKIDAADDFDGFTWFSNTVGNSGATTLSLPGIFTGYFHDEKTLRKYYSGEERNLLDALSENNIDINIFHATEIPLPDEVTSQHVRSLAVSSDGANSSNDAGEIGQLFDLFLIRSMPFFMKNIFLDKYQFFFSKMFSQQEEWGNEIYRRYFINFVDSLYVEPSQEITPKYYFVHLIYPHPPFSHKEDCTLSSPGNAGNGPEQFSVELACALKDVTYFLTRLKELGVYDNTLIVFHADTGSTRHHVDELKDSGLPAEIYNGRPFPILAVKRPGAHGQIIESDAVASIQDIPNTIMGALGLPTEFGGFDLFSDQDLTMRKRRFSAHEVGADPFDPTEWTPFVQDSNSEGTKELPTIRVGERIEFGVVGLGHLFRESGWDWSHTTGTYAYFPSARLKMKIDPSASDSVQNLLFDIRFRDNIRVPFFYSVNGGDEKQVRLSNRENGRDYSFRIPIADDLQDDVLTIDFIMKERVPARLRVFLLKGMSVQ